MRGTARGVQHEECSMRGTARGIQHEGYSNTTIAYHSKVCSQIDNNQYRTDFTSRAPPPPLEPHPTHTSYGKIRGKVWRGVDH